MAVIAIDGPSSSGKSTVAKLVAKKINFFYLDTGAMYRAVTLSYIRGNYNLENDKDVDRLLNDSKISVSKNSGEILLNGQSVEPLIRNGEVTDKVSYVCAFLKIRQAMTKLQREIGKNVSIVMDGRDIGTTVFPDAKLKIFLTADIKERARRRQKDFAEKGINFDIEQVTRDLSERDYKDSNRSVSPLKKAEDAVCIDTTDMSIEEVCDKIIELSKDREILTPGE